jgi:hypothetical protein
LEENIPDLLAEALWPVIEQIKSLAEKIKQYDWQIEQISKERYPEGVCAGFAVSDQ